MKNDIPADYLVASRPVYHSPLIPYHAPVTTTTTRTTVHYDNEGNEIKENET